MAYNSNPTLHMTFVGDDASYDISIPKVKSTPVAEDINAVGSFAQTNMMFEDTTAQYVNAYYRYDSIVASAS